MANKEPQNEAKIFYERLNPAMINPNFAEARKEVLIIDAETSEVVGSIEMGKCPCSYAIQGKPDEACTHCFPKLCYTCQFCQEHTVCEEPYSSCEHPAPVYPKNEYGQIVVGCDDACPKWELDAALLRDHCVKHHIICKGGA